MGIGGRGADGTASDSTVCGLDLSAGSGSQCARMPEEFQQSKLLAALQAPSIAPSTVVTHHQSG
jgi:hypothetical protein